MSKEIYDGNFAAANSASTLSAHVFSDPADFLRTLKSDFPAIAKSDPEGINTADLLLYAEHGSDAKGRAAANIAALHFDALKDMAPKVSLGDELDVITAANLKTDLDLVTGKTGKEFAIATIDDVVLTVGCGVLSAGMGATAAMAVEVPPFAVGMGVISAAFGALTVLGVKKTLEESAYIKQQGSQDSAAINSWINQAPAGK